MAGEVNIPAIDGVKLSVCDAIETIRNITVNYPAGKACNFANVNH